MTLYCFKDIVNVRTILEQNLSVNSPTMMQRLKWIMAKYLGVEPNGKKAVIIFVFVLSTVFCPINIIIGAVLFNDCSAEPNLPPIMIAHGLFETCWMLMLFFLYTFVPRKELQTERPVMTNTSYTIYTSFTAVLTLAVGILVILTQVYIGSLSKDDVDRDCATRDNTCRNCSKFVWYGCWIWLGFKYFNLLKLILCVTCSYNPKCAIPNE